MNRSNPSIHSKPEAQIGSWLNQKNLYLVTAESCTGGLIGDLITNIPGSSDYYLGGVITYSNQSKINLLGFQRTTLDQFGAVSRETVIEMARGVRDLFSSTAQGRQVIGLSISGIAGPGGGTPQKPVGFVWIAINSPEGEWAWQIQGQGNRTENKNFSAQQALLKLLDVLIGSESAGVVQVITRPSPTGDEIPTRIIWRDKDFFITDIGRHWRDKDGEHWLVMNATRQTAQLTRLSSGTWSISIHVSPTTKA